MLRYQGIDWRQKENWNCNERFSPYAEHHYDGLSLDPLEVVFVKVRAGCQILHCYRLFHVLGFCNGGLMQPHEQSAPVVVLPLQIGPPHSEYLT